MTSSTRPFVLHTRVVTGVGGGPEKTILNSPRFLNHAGYDSACLFMKPPGDPGFESLTGRAATAGAEIIEVDDSGPFDHNVIRQSLQVCRERNVRVWHAHDYKSNALGLLLNWFHPMTLVTTAHGWGMMADRNPLHYRIDQFCLKRYARVLCVSPDLLEACGNLRLPKERLSLVDNAIIADDYDPSPSTSAERQTLGFCGDEILLGAVGRLVEEKGFINLIQAVSELVKQGYNIGLIIAGDGELRGALQQSIDSLGLTQRVRLAGFLEDPRELYRAVNIYVLSSISEGLPNVVLEAMASGRAVVATRINGVPRLIEDGINGLIVEPNSVDALRQGITRLLENQSLRDEIGLAGRLTVERQFSFSHRMRQVVRIYEQLGHHGVLTSQKHVDRRQTV